MSIELAAFLSGMIATTIGIIVGIGIGIRFK